MITKAKVHFQNHEVLQVCKTSLKMEFKPLSLTMHSSRGTVHVCQVIHMHNSFTESGPKFVMLNSTGLKVISSVN